MSHTVRVWDIPGKPAEVREAIRRLGLGKLVTVGRGSGYRYEKRLTPDEALKVIDHMAAGRAAKGGGACR